MIKESLYAEYIKERENFEIIEDERGFATFKTFENGECYIRDIFVRKEYRKSNIASMYADQITEIAKRRGCTYLTGTVSPKANGSTISMAVLLGYGFKLLDSQNDKIVFIKEIA